MKEKEKNKKQQQICLHTVHGSPPEAFHRELSEIDDSLRLYKVKPLLNFLLLCWIKFHKADSQHALNYSLGIMLL